MVRCPPGVLDDGLLTGLTSWGWCSHANWLARGFSSFSLRTLQKAPWVSSWCGGWLPPKREVHEGARQAATGLLWYIFRSHTAIFTKSYWFHESEPFNVPLHSGRSIQKSMTTWGHPAGHLGCWLLSAVGLEYPSPPPDLLPLTCQYPAWMSGLGEAYPQ